MSSSIPSFRIPLFQQVPDPVLRPSKKNDCWVARTEDIALPIIASLVGFVFLPVQIASAITFVVTVGSILYYNHCLGCSSERPDGPQKDVQIEKASESLKRTFSSFSARVNSEEPKVSVASNDSEREEILSPSKAASVDDSSREAFAGAPQRDLLHPDVDDGFFDQFLNMSDKAQPSGQALGTAQQDGTITSSKARSQSSSAANAQNLVPHVRENSLDELPALVDDLGQVVDEDSEVDEAPPETPAVANPKITLDITFPEVQATLVSPSKSPHSPLQGENLRWYC